MNIEFDKFALVIYNNRISDILLWLNINFIFRPPNENVDILGCHHVTFPRSRHEI